MNNFKFHQTMLWALVAAFFISNNYSLQSQTTIARSGRFLRGSGSWPEYHSLVLALDFQRGIPLDAMGGNSTNIYPWTPDQLDTYYHFNATNTANRIPFKYPIAAFGARAGGTPLYVGREYNWGIYSGYLNPDVCPWFAINVYALTNFAYITNIWVFLPDLEWWPDDWQQFATNGFSAYGSECGLSVRVHNVPSNAWGTPYYCNYILSLKATTLATNFLFEAFLQGETDLGDMVVDANGASDWSDLFTAEFTVRPPGQAVFLDQPHFNGAPLPPEYAGKAVEELTNFTATATNHVWLTNDAAYSTLDGSPELRNHPLLNDFVEDLRRDPLALTAYVLNEIDLTDPLAYGEAGQVSEESVNLGGVNRSALGTFLERQGSPTEQCALLVYLLRRAGYPAGYVFPTNNNLKLLDTRLSKLLRMQIRGGIDQVGRLYTTNRLITVNYPWVVANISNQCVHIFPWLKDTEIVEGLDLYDYLPAEYDSGFKWVRDYLYGATNILNLSSLLK